MKGVLSAALFVVLGLVVVSAQAEVTQADIQRLQNNVSAASREITVMAGRDPNLAASLRSQLDDASDEVIYLKVKLRKHETVTRADYSDLRDRIDDIRNRAVEPSSPTAAPARAPSAPPPATASARASTKTVPVGTELDVRLQRSLDSGTAKVEDQVDATTVADLRDDSGVIIPAGSLVRGVITSVEPATRTNRTGRLTLGFNAITVNRTMYPIHATVTQALASEGLKGETPKIATGAGVGAILGGLLGGVRGALAGILIGGGGSIAATEGTDVKLAAGTVLTVRLDSPLDLPRQR
jgi:hypothetical protein